MQIATRCRHKTKPALEINRRKTKAKPLHATHHFQFNYNQYAWRSTHGDCSRRVSCRQICTCNLFVVASDKCFFRYHSILILNESSDDACWIPIFLLTSFPIKCFSFDSLYLSISPYNHTEEILPTSSFPSLAKQITMLTS